MNQDKVFLGTTYSTAKNQRGFIDQSSERKDKSCGHLQCHLINPDNYVFM
jgi:hypothetical protein